MAIWRWSGVEITALGIAALLASLVFRHGTPLGPIPFGPFEYVGPLIDGLHWIGAILVIAGVGKIVFLEER